MTSTFKSSFLFVTLLSSSLFFQACSETADQFFGTAVLNTNTINDFGTPILAKHISDQTIEFADMPSTKKKGNEAVTYVQNNVLYMEKTLKDIKALSANNDIRKEIKSQSIAIYEYVIPVYKNEYTAYAKLCDTKAPQEQKDKILKSIEEKYNAGFEEKFAVLLDKGKVFADDNGLKVDWN